MSTYVNQEALDSQIYNPETPSSVLMLQQIMETTTHVVKPPLTSTPLIDPASVPAELKEHVETFNALSTQNPYQGVIVNPASCLIDDITGDLSQLPGLLDQVSAMQPDGELNELKNQLGNDIRDINIDLNTIQDHTDRLTSNLPSLAGIAQAALALDTVMNLLSNPCLGLDGMLGSIMDSGKKLLNDIKSKINSVKNAIMSKISDLSNGIRDAISGLKNKITDLVNQAKSQISSFINKAKAEIMNFAKALLAQARQGLAELLANLPKDPCLRGLLRSAVTGAAAAIIK